MADIGTLDSWFFALVSALWLMLPAYVPNSAAAVLGGGRPIDGGRSWKDGRRLLGDGKTWRGLAGGVLAGIAVGGAGMWLQALAGWQIPSHTAVTVCTFAAGALLGDLAKSFLKRRLGKAKGVAWPVADQYDLVAGALLLTALLAPSWLFSTITLPIFIWILIATPILHRITNIAGHRMGVKEVPW